MAGRAVTANYALSTFCLAVKDPYASITALIEYSNAQVFLPVFIFLMGDRQTLEKRLIMLSLLPCSSKLMSMQIPYMHWVYLFIS